MIDNSYPSMPEDPTARQMFDYRYNCALIDIKELQKHNSGEIYWYANDAMNHRHYYSWHSAEESPCISSRDKVLIYATLGGPGDYNFYVAEVVFKMEGTLWEFKVKYGKEEASPNRVSFWKYIERPYYSEEVGGWIPRNPWNVNQSQK